MTHSETLWTGFDGRGLYARLAEFALKDRDGNPIEASQVKDARVDGDTLYIIKTDGTVIEFSMPDISGKVDKVDGTPGHLVQFGESGTIADSGKGLPDLAEKTYVDSGLSRKAEKTYVDSELSKKADKTYVDEKLATKAEKSYVDSAVAPKADKSYVDTQLSTKAEKSYVDSAVAPKADKSYVDGQLANKADTTYVDTGLSGKVDKVAGKGLSTNDFTDADKSKLDGIDNLPAEEGGSATTLVTTGDKWTWDNKQDHIDYYLNGAVVSEDGGVNTLTLTGSDGEAIVFSVTGGGGSGAIDSISADGDMLTIDVNKNVDIPLATSNTPGVYGEAGLVRGLYEEFQE